MLERLEDRAAQYDEPPAHLYELWNRGLAQGTRRAGARVTLDGCGGDQLFQVSDVLLADLLRTGRWGEFVEARRGRDGRAAGGTSSEPECCHSFPDRSSNLGSECSGTGSPGTTSSAPRRHGFARSSWPCSSLRERDLSVFGRVRGHGLAQTESLLYLTLPVWGWGGAFMRGPLLQEGVEVRSPLLDLRIVDFALRRPIAERADGTETKILLRQAMVGLLPESVLAPRPHRTGMTIGFSQRRMSESYPALFAKLFSEPLRLAELGIVDLPALRRAVDSYSSDWCNEFVRVNLFHTIKTEFWLRGLEQRESPVTVLHRVKRPGSGVSCGMRPWAVRASCP